MPANFTRRRDLFVDAGFLDPEAAILHLAADAADLGLVPSPAHPVIDPDESMSRASARVDELLNPAVRCMLESATEWLFERGGDLATFLWLARTLHGEGAPGTACVSGAEPVGDGDEFHLGALVFGLAAEMWNKEFRREARALIRFLVNIDFDYGDLYTEAGIAYGFFQSRDPNPLAWKLLQYVEDRAQNLPELAGHDLQALELGCGIGNDALGILSSPRLSRYTGCDLSHVALDEHNKRVASILAERPDISHQLIEGDFVTILEERAAELAGVNLIYSYSSLHYFSSSEVSHIFDLVRSVLEPGVGLFCFAIKGKGSIWDGEGTPLYRPDVWINYDGQSRWFPSRTSLAALIDRHGFEMRLHEWHEHWGYSVHGKRDLFHYVICSPRA